MFDLIVQAGFMVKSWLLQRSNIFTFSVGGGGAHRVVPENIRTPTMGGVEILPSPHAFGNSKMLYPPHLWNSRLLTPPLSFRIPEEFSIPSEFPIQSTVLTSTEIFFSAS